MKKFLFLFLFFQFTFLYGNTTLEEYVKEGIERNLSLKKETFDLKKSLHALRQARGLFLPSISVKSRYTRAGGGREMIIPVGDMMNPVNSTLNELLRAIGREGAFPEDIKNTEIPFLREEEQETKLSITQPLFQPAIYSNYRLKSQQLKIKRIEVEIFKKELALNISKAYYNYLKALAMEKLTLETKELIEENYKINQSLIKNHKKTKDVLFRSKADLAKIDEQIEENKTRTVIAGQYFNFLLNRPLDHPIQSLPPGELQYGYEYELDSLERIALSKRDEFALTRYAVSAAKQAVNIEKSGYLPNLIAAFDYGIQGEKYDFNEENRYWTASFIAEWNLFRGGSDYAKMNQARMEKNKIETQAMELEHRIKMEVNQSYLNFITGGKKIEFTREQTASSRETYRIISQKYKAGLCSHIELIDARNTLTNAKTQSAIARYDYQIKRLTLLNSIGEGGIK